MGYMTLAIKTRDISLELALILLLYSTTCFYTLDAQTAYIVMNVLAGALVIYHCRRLMFKLTKYWAWIVILFGVYFFNGFLRLKAGDFNWDRLAISFFQCVLYYIIFFEMLDKPNLEMRLAEAFGVAALLCIITMLLQEGGFFGRELRSVGSTLSGNVNTVGMNLGIMSMFLVFYYGKSKKLFVLVFVMIVMAIMLLTGSKKTLVYIVINVFLVYASSKDKNIGRLALVLLVIAGFYLIFGVEYFYELIGARIVDMLGQMGAHLKNAHYSHSTESRMYMISEGFQIWLKKPILGGGWFYFWSKTKSGYEYSHCNVTELLCSFGLVGTAVFYYPHIAFLKKFRQMKRVYPKNVMQFALALIVMALLIDWMAVTFSSFSSCYIPAILAMVLLDKYRWRQTDRSKGLLWTQDGKAQNDLKEDKNE